MKLQGGNTMNGYEIQCLLKKYRIYQWELAKKLITSPKSPDSSINILNCFIKQNTPITKMAGNSSRLRWSKQLEYSGPV